MVPLAAPLLLAPCDVRGHPGGRDGDDADAPELGVEVGQPLLLRRGGSIRPPAPALRIDDGGGGTAGPERVSPHAFCGCGARLDRWVTPEAADDDLLHSRLSAFPN
jgi:hypothetical protein